MQCIEQNSVADFNSGHFLFYVGKTKLYIDVQTVEAIWETEMLF